MASATLIPAVECLSTSSWPDCYPTDEQLRERRLGQQPQALVQEIRAGICRRTRGVGSVAGVVLGCAVGAWGQGSSDAGPQGTPVAITVDLGKPLGRFTPVYAWFGYDEANDTTMRHGVELLRELHDLSPVPVYIRAHHLLTSGSGVAELKFSSCRVTAEILLTPPECECRVCRCPSRGQ